MEKALLIVSTLCFGLGFAGSVRTLGAGADQARRGGRGNLWVLVAGFALQTAFLGLRGQAVGRCPLTNRFEVFVFVAWAMVLFYLLIGNAYRLSPLGMFTAPLACALQAFALLAVTLPTATLAPSVNGWLEFHAAFSVLAYGAFALAGVAGALYLWQERQLKSRRLSTSFFQMPPLGDLGRVNGRLLSMGFVLLTLGLGAGWAALGAPSSRLHFSWAVGTWAFYGFLVLARNRHVLAPRRLATLSVAAFAVALVTLSGITFVGGGDGSSKLKAQGPKPSEPSSKSE